ncbi:MAG: response regulator transcription factor [Acidobacteria bacterium]|nr:response regulator transcription factor [Acidobacteriota bacterium]
MREIPKRILVAEDEEDLRFSLCHNLQFDGYEVVGVGDGVQGWEAFLSQSFDLLVLDVVMPHMDGLQLLKRVRTKDSQVPVMMLTARSTEMDKVLGLEMGADDYVTKPFGLSELLARVRALLRRSTRQENGASSRLEFGEVVIDFEAMTVVKAGKEIHFSQKEFLLIRYLAERPGVAIDKKEILDAVWGYQSDATTRTIDTHIARIRRKLGDQTHREIIQTVPTVGYKFAADLS